MNNADATAIMTANKGYLVTVLLNDDTRHDGLAISVNSKGVNINVDGKTRSFSMTRVADLIVVDDDLDADDDDDTYGADDLADDRAIEGDDDATGYSDDVVGDTDATDATEIYGDGMSTADVAAIVGMTPKELRVILRRLGLGVGRGRQYGLDGSVVAAVRTDMARTAAASTNV